MLFHLNKQNQGQGDKMGEGEETILGSSMLKRILDPLQGEHEPTVLELQKTKKGKFLAESTEEI